MENLGSHFSAVWPQRWPAMKHTIRSVCASILLILNWCTSEVSSQFDWNQSQAWADVIKSTSPSLIEAFSNMPDYCDIQFIHLEQTHQSNDPTSWYSAAEKENIMTSQENIYKTIMAYLSQYDRNENVILMSELLSIWADFEPVDALDAVWKFLDLRMKSSHNYDEIDLADVNSYERSIKDIGTEEFFWLDFSSTLDPKDFVRAFSYLDISRLFYKYVLNENPETLVKYWGMWSVVNIHRDQSIYGTWTSRILSKIYEDLHESYPEYYTDLPKWVLFNHSLTPEDGPVYERQKELMFSEREDDVLKIIYELYNKLWINGKLKVILTYWWDHNFSDNVEERNTIGGPKICLSSFDTRNPTVDSYYKNEQ